MYFTNAGETYIGPDGCIIPRKCDRVGGDLGKGCNSQTAFLISSGIEGRKVTIERPTL